MDIYLYQNDEQQGPFSAEELRDRVVAGEIQAHDPAWTEESGDWAPLHTLIELPPEFLPPAPDSAPVAPHPYPHLLQEDQDPRTVTRMVERAADLLTRDEIIEFVAVQKHPVINITPVGILLTNKRVMVVRPKLTGMTFEDFIWREVVDVHISEQMLTATITCKVTSGETHVIDHLPKKQARRLYAIAQEKEEEMMEERRQREMEEKRAGATGVFVGGGSAPKPAAKTFPKARPGKKTAPPGFDLFAAANDAPASPGQDPPSGPLDDPLATLEKLKRMLDAGLIEEHEYEAKKTEILSRM